MTPIAPFSDGIHSFMMFCLKKALRFWFFVLFFCATVALTAGGAPVLTVHPGPKDTVSLTLELTKGVKPHVFTLDNPSRLVVDIPHLKHKLAVDPSQWSSTCMGSLRQGEHAQENYLRLVFDLCQPMVFSINQSPANGAMERWHVTLKPTVSHGGEKPLATEKLAPLHPTVTLPRNPEQRKVVVVIDPGHGGRDPGAIGRGGVQEKNVVLAIARELYSLVQKEPGMTAVMTRDGDYYLTLRERLQKARRSKADIFVAIHADIFKYARSHGSSVYALSLKGATSEAARWLAEKDNYSELGGVDLRGKDDVLRSVLIDLSQTATIASSLHLGSALLRELVLLSPLHSAQVEQARFVVLKSPDIPSVLVETGFLSNPTEVKKLTSKAYQQQLAHSIMKGLRRYFHENPPTGTWIAAQVFKGKG